MKHIRRLIALSILCALVGAIAVALVGFSGINPLKLDKEKVLGIFTKRGLVALKDAGVKRLPDVGTDIIIPGNTSTSPKNQDKVALARFGLVADSHNDTNDLTKALEQIKQHGAEYVIALGDYTQVGTYQELKDAKKIFSDANITYYAIPGDHDFWDNKNKGEDAATNFGLTFGMPYQSFYYKGIAHILVNNANLDAGLSQSQWKWLEDTLEAATLSKKGNSPVFVFFHEPLYHPTTAHIMGRENQAIAIQRDRLLKLLAQYHVSEVFAGDIHFYTRYIEPTTQLAMTTVGAVTNDRNAQKPRYAVVTVYTDGSYAVDDLEINQ